MRTVPTRLAVVVAMVLPLTACAGHGTPSEATADRLASRADDVVTAAGSGDPCAVQRAVDALQSALEDAQRELDPVEFEAVATDTAELESRIDCQPAPSVEPTPPPPASDEDDDDDDREDRDDDEDDDKSEGRGRGNGPPRGRDG